MDLHNVTFKRFDCVYFRDNIEGLIAVFEGLEMEGNGPERCIIRNRIIERYKIRKTAITIR